MSLKKLLIIYLIIFVVLLDYLSSERSCHLDRLGCIEIAVVLILLFLDVRRLLVTGMDKKDQKSIILESYLKPRAYLKKVLGWNSFLGSMHILKKEICRRNKLYKIYRRNRNDETWSDYRVQRNLVTKLKRISIKRFCMDSAANATTPGAFWKRLKPLLPRSSRQDISDKTGIIDDGIVVNEPSNLFNEYFSTPALSQDALDHLISLQCRRFWWFSSFDLSSVLPPFCIRCRLGELGRE